MPEKSPDEMYSDEEIAKRLDAGLKRSMEMQHKPHAAEKKQKPKRKKA